MGTELFLKKLLAYCQGRTQAGDLAGGWFLSPAARQRRYGFHRCRVTDRSAPLSQSLGQGEGVQNGHGTG